MTVSYNVFAFLVAASTVFALSVLGSVMAGLQAAFDGSTENTSQETRWKWMSIVFLLIFALLQMVRP